MPHQGKRPRSHSNILIEESANKAAHEAAVERIRHPNAKAAVKNLDRVLARVGEQERLMNFLSKNANSTRKNNNYKVSGVAHATKAERKRAVFKRLGDEYKALIKKPRANWTAGDERRFDDLEEALTKELPTGVIGYGGAKSRKTRRNRRSA